MAQYFQLHPQQPQPRLIRQAGQILRSGGLAAVPTDAAYSLVGVTGHAPLLERIRRIRGVDDRHHFTLMCRDLSQIAEYARVDNAQYRLLKSATPGSYTFLLEGTKELPRRVLHPKRKTIGLRVPEHPVVAALLAELNEPLLSSTLILPGQVEPMQEPLAIRAALERQLDAVADGGACDGGATTVIDLSVDPPAVIRYGRGGLAQLGLREPEA